MQPALDNKLHLSGDLRVLVHADPTFMAMHALKKHFQNIFGTGIQTRALSIDRLRQEIIENSRLKVSRYDIVACDLPWFGELASNGALQPLDALMNETGFDGSDFHPAAVASTRYRGMHYGVPVQTTPELLVYRTDIFSELGFAEPATTDAVLARGAAASPPTERPLRDRLERGARDAARPFLPDDHGRLRPAGDQPAANRTVSTPRSRWRADAADVPLFRGGWYHSGDAGYLDADGYLYLVDRVKDMIVTGGENVYSVEVENTISLPPRSAGGRDRHPLGEVGRSSARDRRRHRRPTVTESEIIAHAANGSPASRCPNR